MLAGTRGGVLLGGGAAGQRRARRPGAFHDAALEPAAVRPLLHTLRGSGGASTRGCGVCRSVLRPDESPEEATERRLKESREVEQRVSDVFSTEDWEREMARAKDKLVVLEVQSDKVCQTGLLEEPELQWQLDRDKMQEPCMKIKHVFQRTARECKDVSFLSLHADLESAQPLMDKLGIEIIPSLQFYKNGQKLWEHRGVLHLEQGMGEGVLYYGDSAANGVHASDFVKELHSEQDLHTFINSGEEKVLTVVNISMMSATPCIRIFPAILALAKSFSGFASFGRMMIDESPELQKAMVEELNVLEVPTFVFYRQGKEVGRHVGSSRGDLIGQILQLQNNLGIAPPPPPQGKGVTRRKAPARAR